MLEMTKDSVFAYIKELKSALCKFSNGAAEQGEKALAILKEFDVTLSIEELKKIAGENCAYWEIDILVDSLFFDDNGLFNKVNVLEF